MRGMIQIQPISTISTLMSPDSYMARAAAEFAFR